MEFVYELIGIGFGPAGIALAAAIEDHFEGRSDARPPTLFLEKSGDSTWQKGMLLRETDIQNHYLRDLVTPRNPRSRFTFANYLKEHNRLFKFGELAFGASGGAVGRLEWSDYITWVSRMLSEYVKYNQEVLRVELLPGRGGEDLLRVITTNGCFTAKRLVICPGRKPFVPEIFSQLPSEKAFHSGAFLQKIGEFSSTDQLKCAVVGSGQNAIEVLSYLHSYFPNSTMVSLHRSIGFRQVDLCPFSNEIFHPEEVDFFHSLDPEKRAASLQEAKFTNYSTVDQEAADALYRKVYEDWVVGKERIRFVKRSAVNRVELLDGHLNLSVKNTYSGAKFNFEVDLIILCTGFVEEKLPGILEPIRNELELDEGGGIKIDREYRIKVKSGIHPRLFVAGLSEHTHGISDSTSFSMMALKAGRIFGALMADINGGYPDSDCLFPDKTSVGHNI